MSNGRKPAGERKLDYGARNNIRAYNEPAPRKSSDAAQIDERIQLELLSPIEQQEGPGG
jgi:hypothetical protein